MNPQLEGVEAIEGTYPFDLRASLKTLRLNRFFWSLRLADRRELFQRNEEEAMRQAGLSDEE